jgi:hypothetical protein
MQPSLQILAGASDSARRASVTELKGEILSFVQNSTYPQYSDTRIHGRTHEQDRISSLNRERELEIEV